MQKELKIRPCRASDASALAEIERESFGKEAYSEQLLLRELKLPISLTLVAEEEGKIVGYVHGWKIGDSFEIHRVAVKKSERGRGVGKKLLRELLKRCKEAGVREVFLEVGQKNTVALNLYLSLGFKVVGERRDYYAGESAAVLRISL
jgi:ribosomal-protein-alanine N-acetyltransferase